MESNWNLQLGDANRDCNQCDDVGFVYPLVVKDRLNWIWEVKRVQYSLKMQIKFEKYIGGLKAVLIFAKFVTLTQSGVI